MSDMPAQRVAMIKGSPNGALLYLPSLGQQCYLAAQYMYVCSKLRNGVLTR
jgi:hypothetical protein